MAVLTKIDISIEDTASLSQDDAANIVQQVLAVLRSRTLSIAYAVAVPNLVITVT